MNVIKNFCAFIIGILLIFIFYYYVSIPIIPCISIHIVACIFDNNSIKSKIFFVIISSLIGIYFYSANAILSIIYYPEYLNILGIILEFVTVFSFLFAGISYIIKFKKELKSSY